MNQNTNTSNSNTNQSTGTMNETNREPAKLITLTAFLIGYLLIDNLNSNEQSALGNFFMLIGQTLCTSGSENFKRDWSPYFNPTNSSPGGSNSPHDSVYHSNNLQSNGNPNNYQTNFDNNQFMSREQTIDMLHRARNIFNQEIDKLK